MMYNLSFWLLVAVVVAMLAFVVTSFEGMHVDATGGPGRVLW